MEETKSKDALCEIHLQASPCYFCDKEKRLRKIGEMLYGMDEKLEKLENRLNLIGNLIARRRAPK